MGLEAVQGLIDGKRGVMIGIVNDHVAHTPFSKAIKNQEKIDSQLLQMIDILSI